MHEEWKEQGQTPKSGDLVMAAKTGNDEAGTVKDWSFLPDGLQGLKEGFDTPEAFWAELSRLVAMINERKVITGVRPESLVSEEDWQAFWKAAGRPDSPGGYKLSEQWIDDSVDPRVSDMVGKIMSEDREALREAFYKGNLTGGQAQALYNILCGIMARNIGDDLMEQKDWSAVVKELWPGDTNNNLQLARRGARYAGLGKDLDESGLSVNPLVLRMAHALGEAVGEAGMPGGSGQAAGLPRGNSAREEMYSIIASDAYRKNDPGAIRKVEALARRIDI